MLYQKKSSIDAQEIIMQHIQSGPKSIEELIELTGFSYDKVHYQLRRFRYDEREVKQFRSLMNKSKIRVAYLEGQERELAEYIILNHTIDPRHFTKRYLSGLPSKTVAIIKLHQRLETTENRDYLINIIIPHLVKEDKNYRWNHSINALFLRELLIQADYVTHNSSGVEFTKSGLDFISSFVDLSEVEPCGSTCCND